MVIGKNAKWNRLSTKFKRVIENLNFLKPLKCEVQDTLWNTQNAWGEVNNGRPSEMPMGVWKIKTELDKIKFPETHLRIPIELIDTENRDRAEVVEKEISVADEEVKTL
jgi:hypothetical protein